MNAKRLKLIWLGLVVVGALILAACGGDDDSADDGDTATTAARTETTVAGSEDTPFEVFALLPQGNDQPYGTTYLPPFEAKAAELGLNVTITNSQNDADKQASECGSGPGRWHPGDCHQLGSESRGSGAQRGLLGSGHGNSSTALPTASTRPATSVPRIGRRGRRNPSDLA
jgi:ABC-type phosphate transport system substrate-binding protein